MEQLVLGISELKALILSVKLQRGTDFSNYSLSSLKRRVEIFLVKFHFSNINELIHKISNDDYFYKIFIKEILVDTTELFREPEFWKELKILVLNKFKYSKKIKILIPECNSGEELYSLLIILKQETLLNDAKICLTSLSPINIDKIKKASLSLKQMEVNTANFLRFDENGNIFDFFTNKGSVLKLNEDLFLNTEIIENNLFTDKLQEEYDLILYRNKMIYYNQQLKTEALNILKNHLRKDGFIAVGTKEIINYPGVERDFVIVSESEKIYKKYN